MGMLGRWIDQAVAKNPVLMQRVLDRPFGTLAHWLEADEAGDWCGCLVGSTALEAGYDATFLGVRQAEIAEVLYFLGFRDNITAGHQASLLAIRLSGKRWTGKAYDLYITPEGDARAIGLIKTRLARRLAALEVSL